jgi:hypothetical protein
VTAVMPFCSNSRQWPVPARAPVASPLIERGSSSSRTANSNSSSYGIRLRHAMR